MTDPRDDTPERAAERARTTATTDQLLAAALKDEDARRILERTGRDIYAAARRLADLVDNPGAIVGLLAGMAATVSADALGLPKAKP